MIQTLRSDISFASSEHAAPSDSIAEEPLHHLEDSATAEDERAKLTLNPPGLGGWVLFIIFIQKEMKGFASNFGPMHYDLQSWVLDLRLISGALATSRVSSQTTEPVRKVKNTNSENPQWYLFQVRQKTVSRWLQKRFFSPKRRLRINEQVTYHRCLIQASASVFSLEGPEKLDTSFSSPQDGNQISKRGNESPIRADLCPGFSKVGKPLSLPSPQLELVALQRHKFTVLIPNDPTETRDEHVVDSSGVSWQWINHWTMAFLGAHGNQPLSLSQASLSWMRFYDKFRVYIRSFGVYCGVCKFGQTYLITRSRPPLQMDMAIKICDAFEGPEGPAATVCLEWSVGLTQLHNVAQFEGA